MAWQLYRLGRWCFRNRGRVVAGWLALLVLGGVGAATLSGPTQDNFELEGIESTDAFSLIEERSGGASADGATARLVVEAPEGESISSPENQALVAEAITAATTDDVASATDPFTTGTVAENDQVAYSTITYKVPAVEIAAADRDAMDTAVEVLEDGDLNAAVGGDAFAAEAHAPTAEIIGIGIAFVVLIITFGSLVAAGMPLITALIGVGIGIMGVTTLSGFVDLSSATPALATMLGLAVGIDYALFVMSRYKSEVQNGREPEEAAGRAIGTAGSAVVFAGLTVVIALAGLSVTGIGFLTQMGLAGAATVAIAVVIALTLLPAILGFAGRRVTSGRIPGLKGADTEAGGRTHGRRWVDLITRFRLPVLVAGLAAAAVVSIPVASMELALPDDGSQSAESDRRQAFDLISDNFGAGANGPLVVVVDTAGADDKAAAVNTAVAEISAITEDVAAVVPPVADPTDAEAVALFGAQLDAVDFATVTVIPESGPADAATKELVDTIRERLSDLPAETGAEALVTGSTAVGVDIAAELGDVFPVYLVLVVGLAFILLVMVFRSLLVPIKATLGFLVSVGVSLGATVAVFQWGWLQGLIGLDATGPVVFILPLLLTGILFGLAMDYEVFLVTRMREEYVHGVPAREAVNSGFQHSARVVTAAALIMIGVFGGFALGDDVLIKTIGFALTVGVVADAFLVRMTLVPALMAVVGDKMWYLPRWLEWLPDLDVEGEGLTRRLAAEAADGQKPVASGNSSAADGS